MSLRTVTTLKITLGLVLLCVGCVNGFAQMSQDGSGRITRLGVPPTGTTCNSQNAANFLYNFQQGMCVLPSQFTTGLSVNAADAIVTTPVRLSDLDSSFVNELEKSTSGVDDEAWSISVWVQPTDTQRLFENIFSLSDKSGNELFSLLISSDGHFYFKKAQNGTLLVNSPSSSSYLTRLWDPIAQCDFAGKTMDNVGCTHRVTVYFVASGQMRIDDVTFRADNQVQWYSGKSNFGVPVGTYQPKASNASKGLAFIPISDVILQPLSMGGLVDPKVLSQFSPSVTAVQAPFSRVDIGVSVSVAYSDAMQGIIDDANGVGNGATLSVEMVPCNSGLFQGTQNADTAPVVTQYSPSWVYSPCNPHGNYSPSGRPAQVFAEYDIAGNQIVGWLAPQDSGRVNGNSASITGYLVTSNMQGQRAQLLSGTTLSYNSGILDSNPHSFNIQALNSAGIVGQPVTVLSLPTYNSSATIAYGPVQNLTATPIDGNTVTLVYQAPTSGGPGLPPKSYTIYLYNSSGTPITNADGTFVIVRGRTGFAIINRLVPGTTYQATVYPNWISSDIIGGVGQSVTFTTPSQRRQLQANACAVGETGVCQFSGIYDVLYQSGTNATGLVLQNGTLCSVSVFGTDPAPGQQKSCYVNGAQIIPPDGYSYCSADSHTCTVQGVTGTIAYGVSGSYLYLPFTTSASIACGVSTFGGDPAPGFDKACFVSYPEQEIGTSSRLQVSGANLIDSKGAVVTLRGVNLGGWLVTEGWMDGEVTPNTAMPGQSINDRFALERLEANFGVSAGGQLMANWQNNFITSADFQWIAAQGYNCVRIPFSWRNLQNEQGQWILNSDGQIDFSRFDWIVQTAANTGLYVVFDLHVWQGQQANYNNVTNSGSQDQINAEMIWNEVSNHFAGNATIAGFDLLNEVYPDFNTFDRLYKTIRANDPTRIVIVEAGDWTQMTYGQELKHEAWTNVMWEPHFYTTAYNDGVDTSNLTSLEGVVAALGQNTGPTLNTVPIYVGEFKEEPGTMAYLLQAFNQNGWSWTPWTYKSVNENGWSMRYYSGGSDSKLKSGVPLEVNLTNGTGDSAAAIAYEWTTQLQSTANFYDNTQLEAATAAGTRAVSASNPLASPVPNGVYALVSSANLYALSSSGAASGQTDWVISSGQYNGGVAQQWTLNRQSDGSYTIQNGNGNMLDVYGWSTTNGGLIDDWPSSGNSGNERWYLRPLADGSYQIVSQGSYLTVGITGASLAANASIEQNQWLNANTQRWYLVPVNGDPTTVLPPGFTACAPEGGTCTAPGSATTFLYAFGGYGSYVVLNLGTAPGVGIPCNVNTFEQENPLPGFPKECFYASSGTAAALGGGAFSIQPAPAASSNWCSEEGGICTIPSINGQYGPINTIVFGVGASYYTKTVYGSSIACNKATFGGDPAPGQTKSCLILQNGNDPNVTASPFGSTLCATEGGTCSFVGYEAVSYVGNGTSKTTFFSGSVVCNGSSFGVTDNPAASCYVLGSSANIIGEGTYKIINANSGLALDVNGASTQNGGVVDQWGYYGPATNQHWTLVGNGNFQLVNQNSGLVLDINGGSGAIDQWANSDSSNQYWYVKPNGDGTYAIVSALNNGVLQVTGSSTASGGALSLGSLATGSSPAPNQKWYIQAP